MQYGFLIDHDRCIGCHACTVACKSENDVPVGNFRTWVKYTEKGTYPEVKRHFAVLRCNHCTKAPCVTICPVKALEKRDDGIVDIDRDACIGCRACMQACPYDAIYLNDDHGAVEKCHFCAHRVEAGLEPACAIVCPEEAIIAGDLHDPKSRISRMLKEQETLVRRPEQRTGPNVHYAGVLPESLQPGAARRPDSFLWSDRPKRKPESFPLPVLDHTVTTLDTEHRIEWGWPVALYLVTKGIGAGAAMLAPFGAWTGVSSTWLPESIALLFTIITTILLVEDLKRPMRFYRLLTRPNFRSWLVKGGFVLGAFGATTTAILGARALGMHEIADLLRWPNALLGLATACYTAFLFGQCEGRDLWQGRALLPHLFVQALACGSVALVPLSTTPGRLALIGAGALLLHGAFAAWERYGKHHTENARQGAAFMGVVRWFGMPAFLASLAIGVALPIALLFTPLAMIALVPAFLGLYMYEWSYVRGGQLPPLS